mgnify:CR=1 FL=1
MSNWTFPFLYFLIVNIIPDYISLTQTRLLIRYLKEKSPFNHSIIIIIDFALSVLIFFIAWCLFSFIAFQFYDGEDISFSLYVKAMARELPVELFYMIADEDYRRELTSTTIVVSLLTSLLTSFWLYLIIIGGYLNRFFRKISPVIFFVNSDEKPLTAIGWMSVLAIGPLILLGAAWSSFFGNT